MKKQKRIVPNVIRGGVAIPLGANYFLMKGKTHEQGGIDIGKDLEVENGELMKIDKNNMTIVSNAPIMNGISPAEYALGGLKDGTFTDRFKEGFKYQEKYKDINGLKDDGTKANFGIFKKLFNGENKKDDTKKLVFNPMANTKKGYNKVKGFVRVNENDSPSKEESEKLENDIAQRQKSMYHIAKNKGYDSEPYYLEYIPEKEIMLKGAGRVSSNMIDSIAVNSTKAGTPFIDALGLFVEETKGGASPNLSTEAWVEKFEKQNGRKPSNDEIHKFENAALNASFARNHGGIHPQFAINNHEWHQRGWEESPKYKAILSGIESPLEHGFTLYNLGLYNSGDRYHTNKVKAAGQKAMSSKVIQQWLQTSPYAKNIIMKLGGKLNTRNKYLIGGETIDKSKLTLDEYIKAKADSTRNAAYEKSVNRTRGIEIKYPLPDNKRKANEYTVRNLYISHPDFVGPAFKNQMYDINDPYMYEGMNQAAKELENNCEYGLNCIGTATDNYPESSRTVVNTDFYNNHSKYGFTKIPFEEIKEGDIVQASEEKGLPYHGMIFAGYDKYDQPTFNYSRGGISEDDYQLNGHYPSDIYHAYRYVGTPELIQQWTNEYNQKRLGGKADMKQNKRNVPSTGEKKKAELGKRIDYLDLLIPGRATKAVSKISSKLPDKLVSNIETPKLKSVSEAFVEPTDDRKSLTPQQKEELISGIIEGGAALTSAGMLAATTASNNKMLNNLQRYQDPTKPILSTRQRLKTSVNVNPQLTKSKRILDKTNKFVLNNTSSSQSAYNRIRQNNFDYIDRINDIYSQKENTETGLINQDRTADNENVRYNNGLINQYLNRKDQIGLANRELDNTIAEKKAENKAALYQGISDIVTNMVTNYGKRKQNNKNLRVMAAGFPSITPEYLNEILYR